MEEEKEISSEDVKKEYDAQQQAEAESESSTEKTEVAETSAEDVKTETAEETETTVEKTEEETEPKAIPYSRFKEVNDKLKRFEELEKEASALIEIGSDGKLRLKTQEKLGEKRPEEKEPELSEEEQLAFDSVQLSRLEKLLNFKLQQREKQAALQQKADISYREESKNWWDKAQEDFKEQGIADKKSKFYERANKIFMEQYYQDLGNGRWTAPPKGHYLACLQAEKELAREKAKNSQSKIEEKKVSKSNVFVEKKSGTQQVKKKVDEKDFESLKPSEQEDAIRAQFEETHPNE